MNRPFRGHLLLVGEGDFSLSVSLLSCLPRNLWGNITSTSFESDVTILKHKSAKDNIQFLREHGVNVFLNADATNLLNHEEVKGKKYCRIVFNFPHVGGKSNHKKNRKLLKDFFCSAVDVLEEGGEVYVSLCRGQGGTPADRPRRKWHDSWQVVAMAACADLVLQEVVPFVAHSLSDYSSTGFRSQDKGFNTEGALTHIFVRTESIQIPDDSLQICHELKCLHNNYIMQKTSRKLHKEDGNPVCYLAKNLETELTEKLKFQSCDIDFLVSPNTLPCHCQTVKDSNISETKENLCDIDQSRGVPVRLLQKEPVLCTVQTIEEGPISLEGLPVMHCMMGSVPEPHVIKSEAICRLLSHVVSHVSKGDCELKIRGTKIYVCRSTDYIDVGKIFSHSEGNYSYELFFLNLDKLAVALFQLPNIRILWSLDSHVITSFHRMLTSEPPLVFPIVSLYPLVFYHDMSFWENAEQSFNEQEFLSVVREVCGDVVVCVELLDRFHSLELNKFSRCYRLQFQSFDRALSYNTSWGIQSCLRLCVANHMKVELR